MESIPIFQVVRIDDTRVVIRHYNEVADKFEKICSATHHVSSKEYQALSDPYLVPEPEEYQRLPDSHVVLPKDYSLLCDKLLITPDGRICYSYKGRLYYPGKVSDLVTVLSATTGKLQMLDISVLCLPVNYLFIRQEGEAIESFDEVVSYKKIARGLECQTLSDGRVEYFVDKGTRFDKEDRVLQCTVLYRR